MNNEMVLNDKNFNVVVNKNKKYWIQLGKENNLSVKLSTIANAGLGLFPFKKKKTSAKQNIGKYSGRRKPKRQIDKKNTNISHLQQFQTKESLHLCQTMLETLTQITLSTRETRTNADLPYMGKQAEQSDWEKNYLLITEKIIGEAFLHPVCITKNILQKD